MVTKSNKKNHLFPKDFGKPFDSSRYISNYANSITHFRTGYMFHKNYRHNALIQNVNAEEMIARFK